jgi:hypothetical protein
MLARDNIRLQVNEANQENEMSKGIEVVLDGKKYLWSNGVVCVFRDSKSPPHRGWCKVNSARVIAAVNAKIKES